MLMDSVIASALCVMVLSAGAMALPGYLGYEHVDVGGQAEDYHTHPQYKFDYVVHDPHSGDAKSQWETRDGDVVKGSYSLVEPDGTIRTVEYTADKHNGFNAVVKKSGHAVHPQVVHTADVGHDYAL